MKGIARVYDHVTPDMRRTVLDVLEARWLSSLAVLTPGEQERLADWFPHLRVVLNDLRGGAAIRGIPAKSPDDLEAPSS
jgi:hypothetical protein